MLLPAEMRLRKENKIIQTGCVFQFNSDGQRRRDTQQSVTGYYTAVAALSPSLSHCLSNSRPLSLFPVPCPLLCGRPGNQRRVS